MAGTPVFFCPKLFFQDFLIYISNICLYNVLIIERKGRVMEAKISGNSYDFKAVTPVPVIASFDTHGHILPLYVRLDGISYKICSCRADRKFSGIVEFCCRLYDGNSIKILTLTYYKKEDVWAVPG